MNYVIMHTNRGGGFVSKPGSKSSYTFDVRQMVKYATREEAERNRCIGNEIVLTIEEVIQWADFVETLTTSQQDLAERGEKKTEKRFTPGPWTVERSVNGELEPFEAKSMHHLLNGWSTIDAGEREANAQLIAAAPDLLAALESAIGDMEEMHADELTNNHYGDEPNGCLYCQTITIGRAAIAKALGKE